jgi:L-amino acid N-acyltransferase YncA
VSEAPVSLDLIIRSSTEEDVPAMLDIYQYFIGQGVGDLGAYEMEPFLAEDLKQRRKNMRKNRLPHLVAEQGGVVAGYAYAVPFRKRPAYRFTLKHSIYIHRDFQHLGIGRRLLPALVDACAQAGYLQLIGYIDSTNLASLGLHERCGFERVGLLKSVSFKYDHWNDTVLVQRPLGLGDKVIPAGASPEQAPLGENSD